MSRQPQSTALLAGAAEVDITPKMGTQIAGDIGRYRPAELVVDPIYAKALVLQSGAKKLCLLSMDLCIINEKYIREIRRRAGQELGIAPQAVLVHVVQNHAAPALGHAFVSEECTLFPPEYPWLKGGDDEYHGFAVERAIEAVRQAARGLEPVRYGAASGVETRVAFNRRFILRDGSACTHGQWRDPADVLQIEGPIDPELGVMCFTTDSLRIVAMLLHHSCHPTHGYPERFITAGWPGAWSSGMKAACGAACVPLVLNGCCGNLHHCNHLDPSHDHSFPTLGRRLTETSCGLLKKITYQDQAVLDARTTSIRIRMRQLDPAEVERARALVAKNPQPMWIDAQKTAVQWDWVYAVSVVDMADCHERQPFYEYEIQVLRIGDYAVVGLAGEPFVEGQLHIKRHSPARRTYVAHFSTGYAGYVPTREALTRGGYETRTANWSKLVPEALEMIADGTVRLLGEMFPEKGRA